MTSYEFWMTKSEKESAVARHYHKTGEEKLARFHYNASEGFKKKALDGVPIPENKINKE